MIQTELTPAQKRSRINEINERLQDIHAALISPSLSLDDFSGDYKNNREFNKRYRRRMTLHIERNQLTREREEIYENM